MNLTTAIFLVNDKARAMRASYEEGVNDYVNASGAKIKTPIFKTLDSGIKVGDLVVVPTGTRHGFTVVKVTEADVTIDFEDKTPVEWIVGKVDVESHKETLKKETELTEQIKAAEFKVRRNQLMNALDLSGSLTSLPLASK